MSGPLVAAARARRAAGLRWRTAALSFLVLAVLAPAAPRSVQAQASDDYNDNKLLCMAEMVSSIENICSQDTQRLYVALEARLREYLTKCFHTSFTTNRTLHEMMPDINAATTEWLRAQGDAFKLISEVEDILPTFVPSQQVSVEVEFMLHNNLASSYDGWLLDPYVYGSVAQYQAFYPLDPWVNNPLLGLEWDDVLPFVRQRHVGIKGQVVALPLDVRMHLLFYRRDLLGALANNATSRNGTAVPSGPAAVNNATASSSAVNATQSPALDPAPPRTWAELLEMAAKLHNKDLNGDGTPDYGICLDVRADCGHQFDDVMGIAASMLQYQGTQQGVFFDPATLATGLPSAMLTWNPAFQAALSIYVNLTSMAPPFSPTAACDKPTAMVDLFRKGRCAFIMGSRVFKNLVGNDTKVRGLVGVDQLPGSPVVFDRDSNTTVACTRARCPFATENADGSFVNQVPWNAEGGWVLAVNGRSTSNYLNATVAFHAYITSPLKAWNYVTNSSFEFEPYRTSHLSNLQPWLDAGYDANDTARWLGALTQAMDMSAPWTLGNNIAMDLRIPGTRLVRDLYTYAVSNATLKVPVRNVSVLLATSTARLLQDSQKTQASLQEIVNAYHSTIGYSYPAPPPSPPAPFLPPSPSPPYVGSSSSSPSWLPIAIILPVIGVLLLVAMLVMYEVRNKRQHKDMFGNVLPPKISPDTSILALEIEDIETISSIVPAEVLTSALNSYVAVVRQALQKHSGYEASYDAATGALTAAFHSPKDALLAGLAVQTGLLNVTWPAEILALPGCAPIFVHGLTSEVPAETDLKDILDVNDPVVAASVFARRKRSTWQSITSRVATTFQPRNEDWAASDDFEGSPHHHAHHDFHLGANAPAGPTIPALVHLPTSQTYSFAAACQQAWKETNASDPNKVLVFKGLRVRMGVHAGVTHPDSIVEPKEDKKKHRVQYLGHPVQLAVAIAQTAQGGVVLLSEDTYKKLPLERLWDAYLVIHVGEHQGLDLQSGANTNLYHALNRKLEGRLSYLTRVSSPAQIDTGVLDAPVGCVTVAFMNVVGAQTLLSWNADIAQSALKRFHAVVGEELKAQSGYLVEAVDGLFLAAFLRPYSAITWALECNDLMIKQAWPDELLTHELCEELVISSPTRNGDMLNMVVFRGPRLKTGVDTGQVLGEVHAMTGRMTYRGKVMNRAARIASTASTGQVLCSADTWELVQARDAMALASGKITSTSLGQFRLKGVADRIEIQHCRKAASAGERQRRASTLMVHCGEGWNWAGGAMDGAAIDRTALPAPATLKPGAPNMTSNPMADMSADPTSEEEDEEHGAVSKDSYVNDKKKRNEEEDRDASPVSPDDVTLAQESPDTQAAMPASTEEDPFTMAVPGVDVIGAPARTRKQ